MSEALTPGEIHLLPESSGVYLFRDAAGEVIYVGKARSLRHRVRSYFRGSAPTPKTRVLREKVAGIEYIVTDTEVEALILECNLIKRYRPKYNIRLVDDKHYPYLKVTWQEDYPRVFITRAIRRDGARYFGPYTRAGSVHETLRTLRKIFPFRTCSDRRLARGGRPCLHYHIKRCMGPCQEDVGPGEYRQMIEELIRFLEGRHDEVLRNLEERMQRAAADLEFERAAELRDQLLAAREVVEGQKIISESMEDQDILAFARDEETGEAAAHIFFVRAGKMVGREVFALKDVADMSDVEVMTAFANQYYAEADFVPRYVLTQFPVEGRETLEKMLSERRGARVYVQTPQRGQKRRLVEMVAKNARLALQERRERRERERERTVGALEELARRLGLERAPRRIECFDVSNIQGREAVGSMVVFEDGRPLKAAYRRFKIRLTSGPDDYAMMREIVSRRFRRALAERERGEQTAFGRLPDLLVVDGGKGQLSAAREALAELGLEQVPSIGLAKRLEEVFRPGESDPVEIPPGSPALHLLQRLRDEAHRFAVSYHRSLRRKAGMRSLLDEVPGIGPRRKRALLRRFGSLDAIRRASVDELAAVEGMTRRAALALKEHLGEPL